MNRLHILRCSGLMASTRSDCCITLKHNNIGILTPCKISVELTLWADPCILIKSTEFTFFISGEASFVIVCVYCNVCYNCISTSGKWPIMKLLRCLAMESGSCYIAYVSSGRTVQCGAFARCSHNRTDVCKIEHHHPMWVKFERHRRNVSSGKWHYVIRASLFCNITMHAALQLALWKCKSEYMFSTCRIEFTGISANRPT